MTEQEVVGRISWKLDKVFNPVEPPNVSMLSLSISQRGVASFAVGEGGAEEPGRGRATYPRDGEEGRVSPETSARPGRRGFCFCDRWWAAPRAHPCSSLQTPPGAQHPSSGVALPPGEP